MGTLKIKRDLEYKLEGLGVRLLKSQIRGSDSHICFTIEYGNHRPWTFNIGGSPSSNAERRLLADVRHYMKFGPTPQRGNTGLPPT
jgi:hypothetical protein